MNGLIKWLMARIKQVDLIGIIKDVLKDIFTPEMIIDFICDLLDDLAAKTKTKLDDKFVEGLRKTLEELFLKKIN